MWGPMGSHMYGSGWIGWIFSFAILVVIIVGIALLVWLLLRQSIGDISGGKEKMPLDILKERYAKGEISKEEFDKMKKDLQE